MQPERPILLIEDDPAAAELLGLALKKAGLRRPLRVLADGDEAIAYLSGAPPFENRNENPPPCLLLLDVKLPRKSGLEVLTWMRSQSNTRPLPVVMLTSSMASKDIEEALRLGIRAYCIKPSDFNDLKKLARMIRARVESKDADAGETGPAEIAEGPPQERPSSSVHTAP
jgi:DNA-binding response OmpR family regulator